MKIGLITIFHVPNNGALLQCYALSTYLKGLGHEVFLYDVPFFQSLEWVHNLKERIFSRKMLKFIRTYLPHYTSDLSTQADVYMVGSDQVWNPAIVMSQLGNYMLAFAPKGSKKVSYAASFGIDKLPDDINTDEVANLLKDFQYITVRETSGVLICENQLGVKVNHVLDPTFLLKDYSEIIGNESNRNESNNLVVYKLNYSYDWYLNAKSIAEQLGCKLKELNGRRLKKSGDLHGFNVKDKSVREWLTAIANAKYVITDSFHGCVFSIIFGKRFVIVPGIKSRSTRLTSLLADLDLSDRIVNDFSDWKQVLQTPIDYEKVNQKLDVLRERCYSNLDLMLQN